jgi:hypothetical protein
MKTAVVAAARSTFCLQVFDDTYVFASKFSISFIGWTEWDGGTSLSKFGSLCFSFIEGRQQRTDYTIGIVYIPDDTLPTEDVWDMLASWIKDQQISLVTGNFGVGNADGITKTAVAAVASVNHRICSFLIAKHTGPTASSGCPAGG